MLESLGILWEHIERALTQTEEIGMEWGNARLLYGDICFRLEVIIRSFVYSQAFTKNNLLIII